MDLSSLGDVLLRGGLITLLATLLVGLIALPLSFVVGVARFRARSGPIRFALALYVEVFRGTSAIVQLFWAFFVLPSIGIELSPFVSEGFRQDNGRQEWL